MVHYYTRVIISCSSLYQTYKCKAQGIGGLKYHLKEDAIS